VIADTSPLDLITMLETLLTLTLLASTTFTVLLLCAPSRYIQHLPPKSTGSPEDASTYEPKVSVQVLVLGDIGRSPRMQYHAMSIAKHGGRVDVVGYAGSFRFFLR
jgi:beta-1,4-mannosyltransferase